MNILFITATEMRNYNRNDIYADMLHAFHDNGAEVYAVSTNQKRTGMETSFDLDNGIHALRVKTGNITNCGMIEKGISLLFINHQIKKAIKQYLSDVKFDLVLYVTPPITVSGAIRYIKRRDHAKSYLMLKDIFPQNAVDLNMMSKRGLKAPLYWYFRMQEKKLYAAADRIGCMSVANVNYILQHNSEIKPENIEVCPNSLNIRDMRVSAQTAEELRRKYDIPLDKRVFVYGGNLGRPQGIPFIIECLRAAQDCKDAFFLIVGGGTEYDKLEEFFQTVCPKNAKLMKRIPKEDYDRLVAACDVGMIFLDHRFTIPNFPSRLLSYMQAGLPVLACTDPNTDIGQVAQNGGFGWWCESNDVSAFVQRVDEICRDDLADKGAQAMEYLKKEYSIEDSYQKVAGLLK